MNALLKLSRRIDAFTERVGKAALWLVLIVVLIQNKFSYVVVNDEAAAKDGVSNLEVMEQNYATGVYEETAFKYAITISSSGTQVAAFDITEIVNDWFKG